MKQFYPMSEDSLQSTDMIDVFKNHSKFLKYIIGKLKKVWKTSISYDSSFTSGNGCRPPLISKIEQIFTLVAGFAFISREYISEHLPMTASET